MGSKVVLGEVAESVSEMFDFSIHPEFALINTSDVEEGLVLNHEILAHEGVKGQFKKSFQEDDILYSEIRPGNRRYAYIDFDATNYVASTKLMVLRCNTRVLRPKYLFYFLSSQSIVDHLQMIAESRSGTFPQITYKEIARLELDLPSLEIQDCILTVIEGIDSKLRINNQINDYLAA